MEIKTKFNIGDRGLILDKGTITEVRINEIAISVIENGQFNKEELFIEYSIEGNRPSINEDLIFKTTEDLFESIPVKFINE